MTCTRLQDLAAKDPMASYVELHMMRLHAQQRFDKPHVAASVADHCRRAIAAAALGRLQKDTHKQWLGRARALQGSPYQTHWLRLWGACRIVTP